MEFVCRSRLPAVLRILQLKLSCTGVTTARFCSARPTHPSDHQNPTLHKAHIPRNKTQSLSMDTPANIGETVNVISSAVRQPGKDELLKTKRAKGFYEEAKQDLAPYFSIAHSVSSATLAMEWTNGSRESRSLKTYVVEVNGVPLTFEKVGIGKHAVLLMPGAIGSSQTDFGPQLSQMNRELFQLIAWNPRGYGLSQEVPRDWSSDFFERDARDAARLMHNLGIERYSVLGWSDGGITALILSALFPQNVHKLVVWGANAYVTREEVDFYDNIRDISAWSKNMREPFVKMYGTEKFQQLWSEWIDGIKLYMNEKDGNFCKHLLHNITAPTLVLHGDKDPLVPKFHADYLMKHIPSARYHSYPDGKHNFHFKYAREFNSLVEHFLIEPIEPTQSKL